MGGRIGSGRGWQRGERSLVLKLCSARVETRLEFVSTFLPKNCGTSSVIVEAGTREEAEFVAAVQYDFRRHQGSRR